MNKLEILDKIIDYEDALESEALSKIPQQVTQEMKRLFGQDGVAVANTYYKNDDTNKDEEDCPECANKAKELISYMKLSQTVSDSLNDDSLNSINNYLENNETFKTTLKHMIIEINRNLRLRGIQVNDNMIKKSMIKQLILNKGI